MDAMTAQQRTGGSRVRTLVIGFVVAALAAVGLTGLFARGAAADPTLPPLTAAELLNRVATAKVDGFSATFTQRSNLGLPALPSGLGESGEDLQDALTLLTGEHTIRAWAAGTDRSRVSLVDEDAESSVIRNGTEVWTWSSEKQKAGHATLDGTKPVKRPAGAPATPAEAIDELLDRLTPSTEVSTSGTGYVAGRAVYQLLLEPKDSASLVGQVRVSIDAEHFLPLGVRVLDRQGADAMSLVATAVDFAVPDASVFAFTPPPGTEVTELDTDRTPRKPAKVTKPEGDRPTISGTGWTTVAVIELEERSNATDPAMRVLLDSLPAVSGSWGSGRLLSTSLVNVVLTDDGRVAIGAVTEDRLYAALAK